MLLVALCLKGAGGKERQSQKDLRTNIWLQKEGSMHLSDNTLIRYELRYKSISSNPVVLVHIDQHLT